ncbi:GSCFA domain-containing protein [Flexithrix dorotheae]|uniref:GSCFA domain-containing protein n=1 Tax=Flexithrix dorotheae TaxID=70993 RepID=UPI00036A6072|nr:GSCFA domain-containing protein [Flexithrix dorotheae]
MSTFRTELHIEENPEKIQYNSKILSLGSGFSHHIANHFFKYKFRVNSNPFGTIYNPISIFNLIDMSLGNKSISESLITKNNDVWNHFYFHFKTKASSRNELLENLKREVKKNHEYLKKTDFLILTFGSAYVYKHAKTHRIVANCHKAPAKLFNKELLTTNEIIEGFRKIYHSLNHIRDIILIVSPVMHTKGSITLNAVSKSVLRLACHQIKNEFPHVKYFPAYEFLLDDLRDYRFYEKDLIHPNEMAMDYIFNKFVKAYVDKDDQQYIMQVEEILEAVDHVPYNPQSEEYQSYIKDAIGKIENLGSRIDSSTLLEDLKGKLK